MSQETRIRVAIVGAGIAGLTLAVALNAFDKERKIAIDLYESAPELSEIGAGINIWPRTWQVLREIGLGDTLIPLFDHYPDLQPRIVFEVRKADQQTGFKVIDIIKEGGSLRIHRADFQRSLIKHLPLPGSIIQENSTCTLHLSHRLVNYSLPSPFHKSGPISLIFADGKPNRTCDILIGADGIKSTIRQLFLTRLPSAEKYQPFLNPVFSGTIAYRGLVEKEKLEKAFPGHRALRLPGIMYFGKDKHTVVYPISGGNFVNVVATVHDKSRVGTIWDGPWNGDTNQAEFLSCFAGWEDEYLALIECINHPTKWAIQSLEHLDIFGKDRVLLLGDSAHAMVPHQGAGAGVGIEDAYILAALLTHPSVTPHSFLTHHAPRVIQIYNSMRVPRAIARSKASIKQECYYILQNTGFERFKEGDDVPREMLEENFREVQRNWSWTTTDPAEDKEKAVKELMSPQGRTRL